jgi:hypothetical protein
MSDTLSLSGGVMVAASLILIGLVIGARILGFAVPFSGVILVAAAVLVVTGIVLMIYTLVAEGQAGA